MKKSFEGKVALITGGASGIGRVAACAFAAEGARVVVSDLAAEGGAETVRLIAEAGGRAGFLGADVTKAEDVKALMTDIDRSYGDLDIALNNAGIDGARAATADYPEERWNVVVNVN